MQPMWWVDAVYDGSALTHSDKTVALLKRCIVNVCYAPWQFDLLERCDATERVRTHMQHLKDWHVRGILVNQVHEIHFVPSWALQ